MTVSGVVIDIQRVFPEICHQSGVLREGNRTWVVGVPVAPVVEDVEEVGRGLNNGRTRTRGLRGDLDGAFEGVFGMNSEEVGLDSFVNIVKIRIRTAGRLSPDISIGLCAAAGDIDGEGPTDIAERIYGR